MKTRLCAIACALAAVVAAPEAQRPATPLPDFVVVDGGGQRVESGALAAGGRAVLVYARPDCRACDQLLGLLAHSESAGLAARLVVVVGAAPDDTAAFAARLPPELAGARWFADADGEAWTALRLKGLPVMMGIEAQRIEWTLGGATNPRLVESAVRTWLEGRP